MREREKALMTLTLAKDLLVNRTWQLAEKASEALAAATPGDTAGSCGKNLWMSDTLELNGARDVLKRLIDQNDWPT